MRQITQLPDASITVCH